MKTRKRAPGSQPLRCLAKEHAESADHAAALQHDVNFCDGAPDRIAVRPHGTLGFFVWNANATAHHGKHSNLRARALSTSDEPTCDGRHVFRSHATFQPHDQHPLFQRHLDAHGIFSAGSEAMKPLSSATPARSTCSEPSGGMCKNMPP